MDDFFGWVQEGINDFLSWLESLSVEEIAIQIRDACYQIFAPGITSAITSLAHSFETTLFTLLLAPLFLINALTASVDIFAGITPLYKTDGNNATALYEASPRPIYMIDESSPQKIPLFSDFDLLPPFPYGAEADYEEDAALISVRDRVREIWRERVQSNPDVVMNETMSIGSPARYYPHVRAFIQENRLGFGTDDMYYALVNAMLSGAAVGTGVRAADIPQMEQIPLDILHKSEQMPKRLVRPFLPYSDAHVLMLEAASLQGLYVPEEPYLTALELKEDLEEITRPEGRYLKTSGYEVTYTYSVETVNEEGETVTETVTLTRYRNTYLHAAYYDAYRQLFTELLKSGWVEPQALEERLAALRDSPGKENNEELARLLDLPIVLSAVTERLFTEANPFSWTNEYMLTAAFTAEEDADPAAASGKDAARYFSALADGYGISFSARYDSASKTMTDATAVNSFYSIKTLWVDFIQNNADIVYNPLLAYDDIDRYTPAIQDWIHSTGVAAGSGEMYLLLAGALHEYQITVSDKPVNLWINPDYVKAYHLEERPEEAYESASLRVTNDVTLPEYIFNSETVRMAFWGITLVSMALCLIFSVYAVLRSMGDLTLQRPVGKVMGLSAKSMLTFLVMPAFCACAVYLSGTVLAQMNYLVDSGGESGTPVRLTGAMFYAAISPEAVLLPGEASALMSMGIAEDGDLQYKKKDTPEIRQARVRQYEYLRALYLDGRREVSLLDVSAIRRDFDALKLAGNGYLFIMSLAAWFLLVLMVMVLIVFLRRIFDIMMLYLASPLFVATIPLDDGNVFKGWREKFVGAVVMGFGSLITFKLLLLLLPLIWSPALELHPGTVVNHLLKALLTLGGAFAVYKSHTLIASMLSSHAEEGESGAMALTMEPAHQAKQLAGVVKNQLMLGARQLTHKGLDKITGKDTGAGSKNQSYLYQSKDKSTSSNATSSTKSKKDSAGKADGNKAEGNKAEGSKADGNKAGGNKAEGNKAGGNKAGGNKAEGNKAGGNKADGNKAEGNKAGGNTADGNKTEGNKAEGNTADGNKPEGRR